MITKLFFFLPVRCNLFLKTLSHFRFNFSVLAGINVGNSHAPSENLFVHVTTRFNISSADAQKMIKFVPSLGRLKTLDNVEQLASTLNRFGCTEEQIASIIRSQPSLLSTSAKRIVEPKLQLLKDFGMGRENVTHTVTWLPKVLTSKLEILRSKLELLKTVFPTQDLLIRAISKNYFILGKISLETLKTSIAFWEDFGYRGTELTMFLLINPWLLSRSSLTPEQRDFIRKIGIHKESNMYKYVVSTVALSRIEVLEARIHNLQLCGLSPEEALQAVRVHPLILRKLEENIEKKMDFMLNHMELSVDFVAKHPRMFSMSLDKVIRPRFLVLQTMAAMNAVERVNPTRLFSMLMMTEAKFCGQIIEGHPESAALWTVYKNAIANVSKKSKKKSF